MSNLGKSPRFVIFFAGIALIATLARPAGAADSATLLEGNHPDEAAGVVGETAASGWQPLAMHVTMALRNRAELSRLLDAQQDPASSEYHRWLTPDEFTSRFGPTDADIEKVVSWLQKKGFTVTAADASSREVSFTSTVAQAQNVFEVKIAASADGKLYANTTDPAVPAGVAPLIESIHGLDNLLHSTAVRRGSTGDTRSVSPAVVANGVGPAFGPSDIYTFYDETPLLSAGTDGSGLGCIGVVEDSDIDQAAADAFDTQFGLPALTSANFSTELVDGTDPGLNSDQLETVVDVNYSHAIAPGSSIRIYLGDQNHTKSSAIIDAIHAAIREKHNPCSAISISFEFCGGSKGFYKSQNNFFAQAAAQGQAVFVASGDEGAAGRQLSKNGTCAVGTSPHINEIAASPNVTAVGGTQFTPTYVDNDDVGFVAESVWDDSEGASGGGESMVFKQPKFQSGLIPHDKKRDIPDISFGASRLSPGFFYGSGGGVQCCVGGTSVGAPSWAGISQLISQAAGARAGNLNKRIYQLGAENDGASTGIRDVTSGDNSFNGVTGSTALPGYDKATGWGTVDMGLFVPAYVGE